MSTVSTTQSARSLLQEYLSDRDEPCPRCGYNLRRLQNDTCPECGDALTIRVGLVEPRLGAFITTLVALSVGTGAALLLAVVGIFEAPTNWWTGLAGIALLILLVFAGTGLAIALALRTTYRRATSGVQWLIAMGAIAFVLAVGTVIVVGFD